MLPAETVRVPPTADAYDLSSLTQNSSSNANRSSLPPLAEISIVRQARGRGAHAGHYGRTGERNLSWFGLPVYLPAGALAFSSSSQFSIRLMCVTTGFGRGVRV